ncbi:hypothetical protein [Hydrogenimonas urashimensis]|uniref:hypothetical protein n=1 Tax=Hydrogenimonas urashimensis TaxID=2740515 RepID=UPI00191607F6|nr:hypothetical protein [Hydrogenimonas urashimensis]
MNNTAKLRFIPMDSAAQQSVEMANLTRRSEIATLTGPSEPSSSAVHVFVLSAFDDSSLQKIAGFKGRGILLFPDQETSGPFIEKVMKSSFVPVPVKLESLAALSFSHAVKSIETLFVESSEQDFSLGEEDLFAVFQAHRLNRFYYTEGRHLREAVLRMAHRVRSRRGIESVAYTLTVPANTALFSLDEALDVLEIAVPPEKPLHFAIRFASGTNHIKISACIASSERTPSDIQSRIDAHPTYLGKLAVIVEGFADGKIDEKRMDELCRENGIEPEDADRLYDIFYVRADETAALMRHLRESRSADERIELIAKALADNFIDVRVLEELANLYRLPADRIIARAGALQEEGSASK